MADFSTLIATLQATIKTNYNQEITGQILQDDLLAMVNTINQLKQDTLEGYGFYGAPLADGASVNVTQNTFFLVGPGTYTINGEANTIAGAGISVLVYDSVNDEVRVYSLISYDTTPTAASKNAITSGAVHTALAAKQDKDTDAVAGNVAVMNASGDSEDGGVPLSVLATKAEVAVVAGEAGLAEAVIDTDSAGTEQEFTFRKSGGDGGAYYRKIKGKTIVANNQANLANFYATGATTIAPIENGLAITSISEFCQVSAPVSIKQGRDYIVIFDLNGIGGASGPNTELVLISNYTVQQRVYFEWTNGRNIVNFTAVTDANDLQFQLWTDTGTFGGNLLNPQIIDLTLADAALTPAAFLALYPDGFGGYNPGTLKSNDAEAVETTGVNQWDEEWEVGYIDISTGQNAPSNATFRSKNYIPIVEGGAYYMRHEYNTSAYILCYDANKGYLGGADTRYNSGPISNLKSGTAYIRFYFEPAAGTTTYNYDICINISNPAINGQYFPYWKRTLQLGLTTRKDTDGNVPFADGMKGAGTAADWADKVGGEKRMGRVDLGSLNYTPGTRPSGTLMYSEGLGSLVKKPTSDNTAANAVCSQFVTYSNVYSESNGIGLSININGTLFIFTPETDPAAFKAAMQGVMLDYELADPVPFTWKEPLNLGVKVDENGTERAVAPEGATAPSAPFVADTTYTMSVARMVEKLQNL